MRCWGIAAGILEEVRQSDQAADRIRAGRVDRGFGPVSGRHTSDAYIGSAFLHVRGIREDGDVGESNCGWRVLINGNKWLDSTLIYWK